jgi:hypothetical protein
VSGATKIATTSLRDEVAVNGFAIVSGMLTETQIATLIDALGDPEIVPSKRGDAVYGGRNLLQVKAIAGFLHDGVVHDLIEEILGARAVAVRGLLFDKTADANWPVPWHQDLSVAIAERVEIEGWRNWTLKAGVHHVQPPCEILERMVTIRIHLDDCPAENGPLRVTPRSHRFGRLARGDAFRLRTTTSEHICALPRGGALVMRPLLLHASSPALRPAHRRVLHLEFAEENLLPSGLQWAA